MMSLDGMEAVYIKQECDSDGLCVKQECDSDGCGDNEAMLYEGYVVKQELVLGPELLQKPSVVYTPPASVTTPLEAACVKPERQGELELGPVVLKEELELGPVVLQPPDALHSLQGLLTCDLVAEIIGDGNMSDFDESDLEERVRCNTENGNYGNYSEDSDDVSEPEPEFRASPSSHRSRSPTRTPLNCTEAPRRSRSAETGISSRTSPFSREQVPDSLRSISPSNRGRVCNNRNRSTRRLPRGRTSSVRGLRNNNVFVPPLDSPQPVASSSRSTPSNTIRTGGRGTRRDRGRSSSTRGSSVRGRSRSNRRIHSADTPSSHRARLWRQSTYDNKDHSWYPPLSTSGVLRSPVDYFSDYFDDEYFKNCAECTNLYYMRRTGNELKTTAAEMKKFFGVLLVMGCISYPRIHMYWRQEMRLELIANVMARDRFFLLRHNVHVVSSDTAPPGNTNPLWKVQPAINAVRDGCSKVERVPSFYSIDEQIIPFTGRCGIRVVVRNKPRPVGLKNYVVTTSEGLMVNFEIYYPKNPIFDRSLGEGPGVILFLAQSVPRGSCIYFNRYFNTVPLLDKLSDMGLHGTGTIMANRIPTNKDLQLAEKKGMKRGDIQQLVSRDVALVKWMDNNVVLMASNCTGGDDVKFIPRWDKKRKEYIPVKAPQVIMNYNKFMGGVDVLDQTIEYYRTFQRSKKWTVKILVHLIDLAAANAWRLYKIDHREQGSLASAKDLLWFRLDVADSLLHCPNTDRQESGPDAADNGEPFVGQNPGRYRPPVPPSKGKRYDGYDHLPLFDETITSPRCCRLEGCTSRSKIVCTKCNVYLCLSRANNCFYNYHKK